MSAEQKLQAAVWELLTQDSPMMELVEGIYDEVPEDSPYPFSVFGDWTELDESTHDADGFVHRLEFHDWSDARGKKELQAIRAARNDVLHRVKPTTSSGWTFTRIAHITSTIFKEWDDVAKKWLRHQVSVYEVRSMAS